MERTFFKRRTWLVLAIFMNLVVLTTLASSGSSFVEKSYTLSQGKAQSFKFSLDGGQPFSFSYDANVTINMTVYVVAQNGSKSIDLNTINSSDAYDKTKSASWVCNITLALVQGYTGVGASVNVRYTFMKTTGMVLSISIAIVAAAMAVIFVWLLISKRHAVTGSSSESKAQGEETDG